MNASTTSNSAEYLPLVSVISVHFSSSEPSATAVHSTFATPDVASLTSTASIATFSLVALPSTEPAESLTSNSNVGAVLSILTIISFDSLTPALVSAVTLTLVVPSLSTDTVPPIKVSASLSTTLFSSSVTSYVTFATSENSAFSVTVTNTSTGSRL